MPRTSAVVPVDSSSRSSRSPRSPSRLTLIERKLGEIERCIPRLAPAGRAGCRPTPFGDCFLYDLPRFERRDRLSRFQYLNKPAPSTVTTEIATAVVAEVKKAVASLAQGDGDAADATEVLRVVTEYEAACRRVLDEA
ncbi:hypothetical protein JCM11491_000418 [Sporobolomyces phaffii]